MNTQALIDAVVQRTMVFIAQLATAGGVRAPLAHVASQVFLDLSHELHAQGVRKKVIADMFGMALRTYHRKVNELGRSSTDAGHTLWEVVLGFVREHEPVSAFDIRRRFRNDDAEILRGVLSDLVDSGLAYRAGRGEGAVYRAAQEADFDSAFDTGRREANGYLAWLAVYRNGPIEAEAVAQLARLEPDSCREALTQLIADGRVREVTRDDRVVYQSDRFEVPLGMSHGWEAAVLDHFQAMLSAITAKLGLGPGQPQLGVGGSTWSLDLYEGHPLEHEAIGTLERVRTAVEDLRLRIDSYNAEHSDAPRTRQVVFYMGQHIRPAEGAND